MSDGNDNWDGEPYEGEGQVATETEIKVKRPKRYKVLLHNDDYTTMEFVVLVLQQAQKSRLFWILLFLKLIEVK